MAEIPLVMKLLWGVEDNSTRRGPQRSLSIDHIVAAAIRLADRDGYGAISMAGVAKQLGFTTMSLYRYVDSKDTLLALLADRAIGPAPAIDTGMGWRAALESWALAEFDAIKVHPWWLDIPADLRTGGPNTMDWLEAGLTTLTDVAIPDANKLQLVSNLSLYVMSRGRLALQMTAAGDSPANHQQHLAQILEPAQYPALTSALAAQAFHTLGTEGFELADFKFGLDRLLDGFAAYIEKPTQTA